jgi:truncated hemoglobin YjbI
MAWLRWYMLTFLSVASGGLSRYAGRDISEAHAPHYMPGDAFNRLLVHLEASTDELEMAQEDQKTIIRTVVDLRSQAVTIE